MGIPDGRALKAKADNFIKNELIVSARLSRAVQDLKNGLINFELKKSKAKTFFPIDSLDYLTQFNDSTDLRLQFIKFGPNDSTYIALARGLIKMSDSMVIDRTTFSVPSTKEDTLQAMEQTRLSLVSKGYLSKEASDSTSIAESLKGFQSDNSLKPDGVIGKNTCKALNESTYNKMERVALSMDKIRARKPYPKKYIRINIPEYKLRYFENDSIRSEHNIVVGKFENQTPELESRLRRLVVYPFWNVPYSISSREILPSVKRDVGYLAKHNYKVYKGKTEIDPTTVNWRKYNAKSFPFKVIQQPGPSNSLGIIKFDFRNEHSVYFHDTPAKGLFGTHVRAYSHGCMRTQFPVELGRKVMQYDSIPYRRNDLLADSLDSLLTVGQNYEIKLIDPIPIYIVYESVVRDREEMVIHIDIYGRDEEYLKIMNQ